jgi:hypothetical protein
MIDPRPVKRSTHPANAVRLWIFLLILAIMGTAASSAYAVGWEVTARALPTHLLPGHRGIIQVHVYNTSAQSSIGPVTVTDTLPEGVTAESAGYNGNLSELQGTRGNDLRAWDCSGIGTSVVTCTNHAEEMPTIKPGVMQPLLIAVNASPAASGVKPNRVTVAGGGAVASASAVDPLAFSSTVAGFGFAGFDGWFTNADGTVDTQAGSHPYELTVSFDLNSIEEEEREFGFELVQAGGHVRNLAVDLPAGLVGDPTIMPRCSQEQFAGEFLRSHCSVATQVGINDIGLGNEERMGVFPAPVYNLAPPSGVAAEFGFYLGGTRTYIDAVVRSGGDYGITVRTENIVQSFPVLASSTIIWGDPADPSHDYQRQGLGGACEERFSNGLGFHCSVTTPEAPLLTLPTSCTGPQTFGITASPWEFPSVVGEAHFVSHDSSGAPLGLSGCDHLGFAPSLTVAPDTTAADTPAGLAVDVRVPQEGLLGLEGTATSNIQNTTVTLPQGMAINPGQAAGLQACQQAESGIGTEGPPACPGASKVGTDEIETPLLFHSLRGNVYVLQSNPPELKLLVAASGEGVNLKLVGVVHLNEETGQLTTTFTGTPELPFTDFKLTFSGGAQAALTTPASCRSYETTSDFTPWSSPFVADAFPSSPFQVTSGPGGGPCPSAPLPFAPAMIAGATTDRAGAFTNFSLLLQRPDGQQRISSLQFKTPEGLLGMISRVPLCTAAQAEADACPEASQIGHTVVEAGPGPFPLVVPQPGQPPAPIYLTEPYKGAPYGLLVKVPLVVGPFVLQTQVIRAKIEVDPLTAQLTITTDPLPQVIDGVPTDLRTINAVIDKPEFMFNPTNCSPASFSGTAFGAPPPGAGGPGASAAISNHFGVGSCRELEFKPDFKVSVSGKNSKVGGAGLTARIVNPATPPGGRATDQAGFARVKVELPVQLPSRLTTLQQACLASVFDANPASCPAASIVGHGKVRTSLLPVPLEGPAYFVSHGGEKFPDLTIVLKGYGVTVDLVGTTFISKKGITSTTFKAPPDVPFNTFELTLPQGKYSALAANVNLCALTRVVTVKKRVTVHNRGRINHIVRRVKRRIAESLVMPTEFVAQNGAELHENTKIAVTGCPKATKQAKAKGAGHYRKRRR